MNTIPCLLLAIVMFLTGCKQSSNQAYRVGEKDFQYAMEIYNAPVPGNLEFPNPHADAQWFPEAGLGLFIHWGIHSVAGIQPSWAMIKDYPYGGSPDFHPPEKYYRLSDQFDPQNYHPDKWLATAKEAGFQYAVLTTKHHDGYALWPSDFGNMGTKQYLNGRDLIKPYIEACRKNGLKVGLYFSPRDWHYPGFPISDVNFDHNQRGEYPKITDPEANHERFLRFFAFTIGQIRELLTQYGKIDFLWFDGMHWHGEEDMKTGQVYQWIRELQPGIVINDRWGEIVNPDGETHEASKPAGDCGTPEVHIPDQRQEGWWETCNIWPNGHWGYVPDETFKPPSWFFDNLVNSRKWGGNFLCNVGPRPDGEMPAPFYTRCDSLSQWMAHSKESLIGAGPSPGDHHANVPITTREGVWYLHVFADHEGPVQLLDVKQAHKIILLKTKEKVNYRYKRNGIHIQPDPEQLTEVDNVIAVYWE